MLGAGLETTFRVLGTTANEAAVPLLLRALASSDHRVAELALKASLARWSLLLAAAVLERWHLLSDHGRHLVAETPGWLTRSIRGAILGYDEQLYRNGCEALLVTRDYELAPVLVGAAEDPANPFGELAAETLLLLAEHLHDELHSPRDYRERRDLPLLRSFFVAALENAVGSYTRHQRKELLEAFLLIAGAENALLRRSLLYPQEREAAVLCDLLATTSRLGILRLLLHLLDDPQAPLAALRLIAQRKDLSFLRQTFRRLGEAPPPTVIANLKRIDAIAWINSAEMLLPSLTEAEQVGAVQFVAHSQAPRRQVLTFLSSCLSLGAVSGRRAAATALRNCNDPDLAPLIAKGLKDQDPLVRAALIPLIRPHHLPHGVELLIQFLASPDDEVRAAAQQSLSEFRFSSYLAAFDNLDDVARRASGRLVLQVDPTTVECTALELASTSRLSRRRGLELATALGLVNELAEEIGHLLRDEDPYLRLEAVRALAADDSPVIRRYLREAMVDAHPLVNQAAEEAMLRRTRSVSAPAPLEVGRDTTSGSPTW